MTDLFITLAWLVLCIAALRYLPAFRRSGIPFKRLLLYFGAKVLAAAALYVIYTRFYTDRSTSDLFKYFDDGQVLWNVSLEDPGLYFRILLGLDHGPDATAVFGEMQNWDRRYETGLFNDAHTLIRLNALLHAVSFGVVHVHSLIMALLSLLAITWLWRWYKHMVPVSGLLSEMSLFLLPSLVFWTSGALKEAVVIVGLGLMAYALTPRKRPWWTTGLILAFGFGLVLLSKIYVAFALLPALAAFVTCRPKWGFRRVAAVSSIVLLATMGGTYAIGLISSQHILPEMIHLRQRDFRNVAVGGIYMQNDTITVYVPDTDRKRVEVAQYTACIQQGITYRYWYNQGNGDTLLAVATGVDTLPKIYDNVRSGSIMSTPDLGHGWGGLLLSAPEAFARAMLTPLHMKPDNPMLALAWVENALLIVFLLVGIVLAIRRKTPVSARLLAMVLIFTGILFVLIGWITPVAGAMVRYRVPALPFMVMAIGMMWDTDLIAKFAQRWKRKTQSP
jgi:hypothetical protein